jgi:polar amino acid transport system substrate-binding protein
MTLMTLKTAMLLAMATLLCIGSAGGANATTLDDVKQKGTLVVGVKADYPPWGMRDSSGTLIGMEIDMANDVAKRLGVKPLLVPVLTSNRMQMLQQGKIDLMIATLSVNDERRKAVGVIEPFYYASGVALLANRSAGIKSPADLKGKPVCALQGASYNRELSEKYVGGDLLAFKGVPEDEQALLDRRCAAWAYDDAILLYMKNHDADKWKDYDVLMMPDLPALPWGIAVRSEELGGPWGKYISSIVADWHKTGLLLELEKKWLGSNTEWLKKAHESAELQK